MTDLVSLRQFFRTDWSMQTTKNAHLSTWKVTCINTMAAGLRYCDRALTVSPSYAVECCTDPEKGVELESLFKLGKCTGAENS